MSGLAKALALFSSGSAIGTVVQIAKGKLSAVLLGVDGVGVLSQLTNIWSLVYTVSGLGFYNGVVKRISAAEAEDNWVSIRAQLASSIIFLAIFSTCVTIIAVMGSGLIWQKFIGENLSYRLLLMAMLISVPLAVIGQIYTGLFSALRLVRTVVLIQISGDVLGLILFAIMLPLWGLWGAACSFSVIYLIKLFTQIRIARRQVPLSTNFDRTSSFSWSEIGDNFRYGASGLLTASIAVGVVTLISGLLIDRLGESANGLFSVAWRVCSLYFGALNASAAGYYFPALCGSKSGRELVSLINNSLLIFMYLLPPVAFVLVVGGDVLLGLLFTRDFGPAAILLGWFLPADVLRVAAETIALAFLARGYLKAYVLLYCVWAAMFYSGSYFLIAANGLSGVGYAYFLAHCVNFLLVVLVATKLLRYRMPGAVLFATSLGFALVAIGAGLAQAEFSFAARLLIASLILGGWFLLMSLEKEFRNSVKSFLRKIILAIYSVFK